MMTRLHSYSPVRSGLFALLASAVLVTVSWTPAVVQAAEEVAEGSALSANAPFYEGTINFVHSNTFTLIVDDHSFLLDRVIRFNNAAWSREQVVQRLDQGDRVKLELGEGADDRSGTRVVKSIRVID